MLNQNKCIMKTFFKNTLFALLIITSTSAIAADKSKKKNKAENTRFMQEFSNHLSYNTQNKEVLQNAFVILEIEIDGNGMIQVTQFNSSKSEAAEYVVGKINGLKIKEKAPNERFIVKYYFK